MNVYKYVQEKEFKIDPKAIKMATKWVVTNKDTHKHTKPTINVRFVGREFADDAKKGGAVCRNARASRVAVFGLQTCSRRCASRSPCRRDELKRRLQKWRALRPTCIDVKAEDPTDQHDGVTAKLVGSLYGTRAAP